MFYLCVICIIGFCVFLSWNDKNRRLNNLLLILLFLILVLQDGLRFEIGTDWKPYYSYFNDCLVKDEEGFEIGYKLSNVLIRSITKEYNIYLIIYAIIFYSIIFYTIKNQSIDPFLSILVLYYITLPYLGMNRQFIAIAICVFSVKYVLRKENKQFIIIIIIASCFHISALLFTVSYWLNRSFRIRTYWIIIGLVFIISLSNIVARIESIIPFLGQFIQAKLDLYVGSTSSNSMINTIFGFIKRFIFIFLSIYAIPNIHNNRSFYLFFNLYLFGISIYIIFNNSIFQIFVARLALFFNIFEIFLIPYIFTLFKKTFSKNVALLLLLGYGIIGINKAFSLYEVMVGYDIFRPYKTFL